MKFHLPEAGIVSLVIEDQQNRCVQNLVSETLFAYRADSGVLRGVNDQTTHRLLVTNKATADVPSEAELTPRNWQMDDCC